MGKVNIMIADDEVRMRRLVSDFLKREGYNIIEAGNGQQALDIFYSGVDIDLIILDIMMPGVDGLEVCKEIRKTSKIPIIMLTAKGEESDELLGFNIGADEYVVKPFSPMILVARVQALLRRAASNSRKTRNYEGLVIDEMGHTVSVDGCVVDLCPKEYELLLYLTENEGIALSRELILNSVWNYDYVGDARTVDTHIKKLRQKLGAKGEYIQTVRGVGYKFEVKK